MAPVGGTLSLPPALPLSRMFCCSSKVAGARGAYALPERRRPARGRVSRQVAASEEERGRPLPKHRGTRGALILVQGCGEPPMTQSPSLNRREVAQEGRVG